MGRVARGAGEILLLTGKLIAWKFVNDPMGTTMSFLGSLYLIDRFGWAGARTVARVTIASKTAAIRLGFTVGKIAVEELGPAMVPRNIIKAGSYVVRFGRYGGAAVGVGVAAYALGEGPRWTYDLYAKDETNQIFQSRQWYGSGGTS